MEYLAYNLNHHVKFKLTKEGEEQFRSYYRGQEFLPPTEKEIDHLLKCKVKEDGYFHCQLHEIITYFQGFPMAPFAEGVEILFEKENLKEVE